jgi:Arc/MetJ-type ribon-helix-helix transcriptional regulator
MTIEIRPEDLALIEKRLQSGVFHNIHEVIHEALASQDAEETWLDENKISINEKISRGLDQLSRGEGVSGEAARARMQDRKAARLAEQRRG